MQGNMITKYFSLIPSEFKLDGGAMFGIIPKPLWNKKIPADEQNRINMALRVLLIKTANKVILIDSGVGDYHSEKFQLRHGLSSDESPLEGILSESLNISANEVTDIIPSHLHFDHVGGYSKIKDGNVLPLFPSATIHIHKKHYKYAQTPTKRDSGSFQSQFFNPLIDYYINEKQINWLDSEEGNILRDDAYQLQYKCSHGHTPYHLHPFDSNMIFMGDLVPTSSHIPLAWAIGYDMQPGVIPDERVDFYKKIIDENLTMIYDHDLSFWGSKVEANEKSNYQSKDLYAQENSSFDQIL